MCLSLTTTTWRLMESANQTSINTNPPIYTCEVGMRMEDGIKRKKKHWNKENEICN